MCTKSRGPLADLILDEIALEGLEGITLPTLWVYISDNLEISLPLPAEFQEQIWCYIKRVSKQLNFYELPTERATYVLFKRFAKLDGEYGVPVVQKKCPFPRYKFNPIQGGGIMGSCECYTQRKEILFTDLQALTAEQVLERWGNKFIIVGNQELRWNALTPQNKIRPIDLTPQQYSLWEVIGRARYNGESTAGLWSLQQLCNDSSVLCYTKQKMIRYGLITSQPFNEILNERLNNSNLLTLPRFFVTCKSLLMQLIEHLFCLLKKAPDYRMSAVEARQLIAQDKLKSFKKISATQQFLQIFETKTMPYSSKTNPKEKERNVIVISLRNPNLNVDELFPKDDIDNDVCNDSNDDFWTYDNVYVDMRLRDECYRAILAHGSRGCTNTELGEYMAITHLSMRQIVKTFLDEGLVKTYTKDIGRQRATMYVAIENSESTKQMKKNIDIKKNLRCNDEPNLPETSDEIMNDIEEVEGTIQNVKYDADSNTKETLTERVIKRKSIVIRLLNEKGIASHCELRNTIQTEEKQSGYKDDICQKSLRRMICNMHHQKILEWYELRVSYNGNSRVYRYITHPKIHLDHHILRHELIKRKISLFLIYEEKRATEMLRKKNSSQKKASLLTEQTNSAQQTATDANDQESPGSQASTKAPASNRSGANSDATLKSLKVPKFLVSRYMHELLFYLIYEQQQLEQPIKMTDELLQHWQQSEPDLNIREYYEQWQAESPKAEVYARDINWRTFIPPIPKYENKPTGWIYFLDVVDRVPLCILNKIFRIEKYACKEIISYISHPVRQHYLPLQLPKMLRRNIISRIEMQKRYIMILKVLNNMGLLRVAERAQVRDPLVMWLYFNKYTRILDTTTTEPGYAVINMEREYHVMHYEFKTSADVTAYWTNLQRVCVYTKLGYKKGKGRAIKSPKEMRFLPAVQYHEAPALDIGSVPGDCAGAGGLGACLFAHVFRNWFWVVPSNTKPVKTIRPGRIAQVRSRPKLQINARKNRLHIPPISVKRLKSTNVEKSATAGTNVNTNSSSPPITKANRSKDPSVKKSGPRDAIDREALNNMRTLRVQWSREEDDMLKISRAVYLYVGAPVIALGLLTVGKLVRDLLRHNLGVKNKTSQACVRRCQFLTKMQRDIPEVPSWLHILQTNDYMQQHYGEDFLKRLKQEYTNRKEYCDALLVHFIKIMQFLYETIYLKSSTQPVPVKYKFIIPDTLEEFIKQFRERSPNVDETAILYKNPSNEYEQHVALVHSVLHATLCSQRDKTLYNLQAFEIYKNYSEEVLHGAFTKARNDSLAVLIKRKNLQLTPTQLAGPAYLLSSKYRMRLIFTKIPYHVYDTFYSYYTGVLRIFFGTEKDKEKEKESKANSTTRKYFELKSPQLGQLIVIAEGLLHDFWKINIRFPVNILTIDAEQREKVSHMDRILDHYSSIFENAPTTEYAKQIPIDPNERQTRVKFHPAHLTYKIQYPTYDIISKLSDRHIHFFCALDSLQQEIGLNLNNLLQPDAESGINQLVCPFNACVLNSANYMDEIERIVCERKDTVMDLSNMPIQKVLNLTSVTMRLRLQANNVLTVMRLLESYWRNQLNEYERKDLGKLAPSLNCNTPIDWVHLCKSLIEASENDEDNERADEYEPTMHKEERAMRAQDVFVVNLPTLQFSGTDQFYACKDMVKFQDIEVPKRMLETELEREVIMKKLIEDSIWKYTENTLHTLMAQLVEQKLSTAERQFIANVHNYIEPHKIGVTVVELMRTFPNMKLLQRALHLLSAHYLIKRVGVESFMYVHKQHIRPWVIHTFHIKRLEREKLFVPQSLSLKRKPKVDRMDYGDEHVDADVASSAKKLKLDSDGSAEHDKRVVKTTTPYVPEVDINNRNTEVARDTIVMKPRPWLRINGSLNRRVLDRWMGAILCECITRNGCSITDICQRFPHMLPVDIMFLLEILSDIKSIQLIQIETTEVNLFSEYQNIKETVVSELYNPNDTYIKALPDALSRMAIFIGIKKYTQEFI